MAEVDTSAPRIQPLGKINAGAPVQFLLTQERTQVLDLLIHLISNSADSVLLCGPEGVGKSKLLTVLQGHEIPGCSFYFVEGSSELSLETIREHLNKSLKSDKGDKYFGNLANAPVKSDDVYPKKILIIDDAGSLAPGLITAIIHYTEKNPQLRVIFALTHDQLHLKYRSDQEIEDCHIVELPPLTEKQCGEFLQHLSAKSSAGVSADTLSDSQISIIYRQTHGIPARIISAYSVPSPRKKNDNTTGILVTSVAVLVVVALAVQWFSSSQTIPEANLPKDLPKGQPVKSPAIDLDLPYLTFPMLEPEGKQPSSYLKFDNSNKTTPGNGEVLSNSSSPAPETTPSAGIAASSSEESLKPEATNQPNPENPDLTKPSTTPAPGLKPAETLAIQEVADADTVAGDSSAWLSSQPQERYTLQLMVLSRQQSILDVMKKYPSLQQNFRYVRKTIQNKEKFILLYGSFSDSGSANKAKKTLPSEFQKAMIRKIGAVQKEFMRRPGNE